MILSIGATTLNQSINRLIMKLIITGATGFVATEVLRQALFLPSVTSVVAVARNSVSPPKDVPAANAAKLKSVVVPDYGTYSEDVRKEFVGADACIWYVMRFWHYHIPKCC